MASTLHLPKLGMTMDSGELVRWLVEDGASVEPGQAIFEMETEKVETEVEAEEPGVLKQLVPEGTVLEPGAIVGCLLAGDESEVPAEILDRVASRSCRPWTRRAPCRRARRRCPRRPWRPRCHPHPRPRHSERRASG